MPTKPKTMQAAQPPIALRESHSFRLFFIFRNYSNFDSSLDELQPWAVALKGGRWMRYCTQVRGQLHHLNFSTIRRVGHSNENRFDASDIESCCDGAGMIQTEGGKRKRMPTHLCWIPSWPSRWCLWTACRPALGTVDSKSRISCCRSLCRCEVHCLCSWPHRWLTLPLIPFYPFASANQRFSATSKKHKNEFRCLRAFNGIRLRFKNKVNPK